tara:strand:+ start:3387 stop:4379 length:993 start_codon:yes stop_codon:yes gene_type:complete
MKMLDLFSGIGGFALAARWTWEEDLDIVGFCEIEEYCQKVLQKNFPNVPIYDDIKKLDGNLFNDIDLITGGFPCQDISQAGRGAGIGKETRSGLWFEMLRIISEVRPRYAIIENVPMLTIRGGTRVIEGLAEIGYDAEWVVIGANDVGAWHTRKRIWIVAYPQSERHRGRASEERSVSERLVLQDEQEGSKVGSETKGRSKSRRESQLSDTDKVRRVRGTAKKQTENKEIETLSESQPSSDDTQRSISDATSERIQGSRATREQESQPQIEEEIFGCCHPREGTDYWAFEPSVGRMANGIPNWVDRIKGLGNAIVPQISRLIMERIKVLL